jgi:hypothetical protein
VYLRSVGAAQVSDIEKLFQWGKIETLRALELLVKDGIVIKDCQIENLPGIWMVHSSLFADR